VGASYEFPVQLNVVIDYFVNGVLVVEYDKMGAGSSAAAHHLRGRPGLYSAKRGHAIEWEISKRLVVKQIGRPRGVGLLRWCFPGAAGSTEQGSRNRREGKSGWYASKKAGNV
jgi:hypothetical protein